MKKLILVICLLFMSSCTTVEKKQDNYTYILFATPLKEHKIWLKAKEGFENACELYDIRCDWIGPSVIDTEVMNNVIETGILQNVDAIITQGVVDVSLINDANEKGIPIFLVDSDIPNSQRFAYMGKDFHEQAQLLLHEIEHKYDKKTKLKIAIQVAEKSFKIAQDQIDEVENVFSQHEGGYEIVSISESKSDQVRAKKEWEYVLKSKSDVNVAINFAAESAEFCADTAETLGMRDQMLIYGVDDMESTLSLITNHKIDGTVVTSFYDYGFKSVDLLLDYIKEGKKPKFIVNSPSLTLVNKDNVDTYNEE